jgi:hypothetical protein
MEEINEIQEINLKLMEKASFNSFNGKLVVAELLKNKDLWEAVVMDREFCEKAEAESYLIGCDLIKLRDLSSGYWNVDTLFILSSGKDDRLLKAVAKGLDADEVDWVKRDKAEKMLGCYPAKKKILRVWWD